MDGSNPTSVTEGGNFSLLGARDITVFESGTARYAAVAASNSDAVQILDITTPDSITAAGSISGTIDTNGLVLDGAESIDVFKRGGTTYAAVAAFRDDGVQIVKINDPLPAGAFVTTWETTIANQLIHIPLEVSGTLTIDWGDGNTDPVTANGTPSHTYTDPGEYRVSMTGGLSMINLGDLSSMEAAKLVSIDQWGDIEWSTMEDAFRGATNMEYRATDAPDLSGVTSIRYMFFQAGNFDGDLSGWDVSTVEDMYATFSNASSFNGDISGWVVSAVTDMSYMFEEADAFDQDISSWDVSQVTNMQYMFSQADAFNQDISSWVVSQVTDMRYMFRGADIFN